ncbi:MAG: DUF4269 domain-containing protein [Pseudomonadota bacterium]
MTRAPYQSVIADLGLMEKLAPYDPIVIGTPPLGIDGPESDIDIACTATSLEQFAKEASDLLSGAGPVTVKQITKLEDPAVTASLKAQSWDIEIFAQSLPTAQQWGVRHFLIEQRLLALHKKVRKRIKSIRGQGMKTEPAFAALLELPGEDPYAALLLLEKESDEQLRQRLRSKGLR